MPAKSKAQQRFMGMVHALQKGEIKPSKVSGKVKKAAKSMKKKDADDFASTKHKGLPNKVKKEELYRLIAKYGAKKVRESIFAVKGKEDHQGYRHAEKPNFKYDEGFGGQLKGSDRKKFEKARKENAEVLGYKLTGTKDIKESVNEKVIKVSKKDDIPGNPMKMKGEEKIKKLTYSGSVGMDKPGSYEIKGNKLNVNNIRPRDKGFFVRHFTMGTGFRKANLYYDGVHWQGGKKF